MLTMPRHSFEMVVHALGTGPMAVRDELHDSPLRMSRSPFVHEARSSTVAVQVAGRGISAPQTESVLPVVDALSRHAERAVSQLSPAPAPKPASVQTISGSDTAVSS